MTATLSAGLAGRGHDVGVAAWQSQNGTDQIRRIGDIKHWMIGSDSELYDVISQFRADVLIFQDDYADIHKTLFAVLNRTAKKNRPRVISVEHNRPSLRLSPVNGSGLLRFARLIKRPYLMAMRYLMEIGRRRTIYANSDRYCLLSNRYVHLAKRLQLSCWADKFVAIPNPLTREVGMVNGDKRKTVVYLGTLKKLKGVQRLLHVWKRIEDDGHFEKWKFVIVGDGPDAQEFNDLACELGLCRVYFVGSVSNPTPYCEQAAIMVMASDYEGWPMVLGEAMSCGCVPICSDSFEAVHDIIDDGDNGFVVPHFDSEKFVARLKSIMLDSEMFVRMSLNAKIKAKNFAIDIVLDQWEILLKEVVK